MSKCYLFYVVCLFMVFNSAKAQVDANLENLRTVVPPSPNASSLGKYGEWPVSLYTGLPGISLPIYELKGRSMSVPISINYHASGIKVGEIASWVGLGWSLNAGGCISRTVQGIPDNFAYFYTAQNYSDPNNFCSAALSSTLLSETIGYAAQGNADTQQDIYNLNVLGKSYRIMFKADTTAYTMPASNIKIVNTAMTTGANSSWKIIMEDGTQLLFGGPPSTTNPYTEQTSNVRFSADGGGDSYISAWYLQSMTSPSGETFTFTYTESSILQDTHFTQSDIVSYYTNSLQLGTGGIPPFVYSNGTSSHAESQTVTQLSLNTIESDLAKIYFIPSAEGREDLKGGVALSEIKVMSKLSSTYTGDWLFNYAYSRSASGNELLGDLGAGSDPTDSSYFHYRLKLLSLTRKAIDNSDSLSWSFSYNPLNLPSRRSFAQDHWGFYNGATGNTSLLPKVPFDPTVCPLTANYGYYTFTDAGFMNDIGQNRSPNEAYMQAEMLTKINYPTGGFTVFNYEGNSTPKNLEVFADTSAYINMSLNGNGGTIVTQQNSPFTLTVPEYVYYTLSSSISASILNDFPAAKATASILDSAGNVIWSISGSGGSWLNLYKPGHYTFRLSTNCPTSEFSTSSDYLLANTSFRYFSSHGIQNVKKLLGGVRVNNILGYDGISTVPVNAKYYVYDSAFVLNPVDTVNDYITSQSKINPTQPDGTQTQYQKLTRNSSTRTSLGTIQGGTVGYGKVTTYDGLNGTNGFTVSSFSCDLVTQNSLPASAVFPYPPVDPVEWRNGLLLSEITYTSSGQPVKAIKNTYNFSVTNYCNNFKVGYSTINALLTCAGAEYGACGTTSACFRITNEEVQSVSSTQILYNVATGDNVSTSTNYYYDNALNMSPTRTVTFNSKSDSVLTYRRTALEKNAINASIPLSTSASAAIDTMVNRNMVGLTIESEKYTKSVLTSKGLTNYKWHANGIVVPDNIMVQYAVNPIETRIQFTRYDNTGNLTEQLKANDVLHDYLYGYAATYPIAEVVNGDSASIAYTSFETAETGGWGINGGTINTSGGLTGTNSYTFTSGASITKTGMDASRLYLLTYWSKSGPLSGVGGTITTGLTKGLWTFYQHNVSGNSSSVSINGNGITIDELRLYPVDALMTTYTYIPLIGMSSSCTPNNLVTYYEYDGLGRLLRVRDMDHNIVKQYEYQYQVLATPAFNDQKSGSFTRNNCASGGTPSTVTYTVPAGAFSSTLSKDDANQKAMNQVNAYGQTYADSVGTCTFYNGLLSTPYTRNNCATGGTPSTVYYTVPAGTYSSLNSQTDADAQASSATLANGQNYANTNGTCTFFNVADSQSYIRNNCSCGYTGTSVIYKVPAGTYSSTLSQPDADSKASNAITTNGQNYANTNGVCTQTLPCSGKNHKIVNCVCETGTLEVISQTNSGGKCITQYGYFFSDGTYTFDHSTSVTGACEF